MKLLLLFMLAAIPICCYASGSGCEKLDKIIEKTIDPTMSVSDYQKVLKPYLIERFSETAVSRFKQCFLDQSKETLDNFKVMMEAIYNSKECQQP
ncbi:secretoglobin family 2A member 2-like [Meriones unguiculatus]|uniref:secretoglobin family 2A member 2-like n=1 Tax=Meriones unguiculatus TaxID=10047 RepID=UPI000B4F2CBE|nr:secretoglobin family 2A member 2-like [Meriones unguiculatus]